MENLLLHIWRCLLLKSKSIKHLPKFCKAKDLVKRWNVSRTRDSLCSYGGIDVHMWMAFTMFPQKSNIMIIDKSRILTVLRTSVVLLSFKLHLEGLPYRCGVVSICYGIDVVCGTLVGELKGWQILAQKHVCASLLFDMPFTHDGASYLSPRLSMYA